MIPNALTNSLLSAENTLTPNRGSKNDETEHKSESIKELKRVFRVGNRFKKLINNWFIWSHYIFDN